MRQRVMIAVAMACDPKILIEHDLGVVAEMADDVVVACGALWLGV